MIDQAQDMRQMQAYIKGTEQHEHHAPLHSIHPQPQTITAHNHSRTSETNHQATAPFSTPPTGTSYSEIAMAPSPSSALSSAPFSGSTLTQHRPDVHSPYHSLLSSMANYQHPDHYSQQQQQQQQQPLQQHDYSSQYLLPSSSHSIPLEQSIYLPTPSENPSTAPGYLIDNMPQDWLWDTYQQAAMDSMQLDHIPHPGHDQRQHQPLSAQMNPSNNFIAHSHLRQHPRHSTPSSSKFHPEETYWHSSALELASRAAAFASIPFMGHGTTCQVPGATAFAGSSSYGPAMTSSTHVPMASLSSQSSSSTASGGPLRPSRSDSMGRTHRSPRARGGRSGRSRSLVSSPISSFLADPTEGFSPDLARSIAPCSIQYPHHHNHYQKNILVHSCGGSSGSAGCSHSAYSHFTPSLSRSAASSSPSPSASPQLSPIPPFAHPSSLSPTITATHTALPSVASIEPTLSTTAATPPAPTFVRLPPPMFQCPMEKCPKSFARAYNLHIHLKTQHHLASKELAAVSPLRAPPSAPPVQIITPEEAAAGVTPSNIATVRAGTTTLATATTATDTKQSNLRSTVTGDNNDRNSNSSGNTTSTTTGYYDVSNAGPDNGSLDCDSSCASSATGVTSSIAGGQGRSFPCHLCPRIFSRKHDLHRHIRVHTGSKPYLCTNCRKAFARTDALCRHYKVEDDCRQVLVELEAAPEDEDSLMQQQLQQHRFHQQRQPGSEY